MKIFKTKVFHRWAVEIGLSDEDLKTAIHEMLQGLYDANLGGFLYKKRIGIQSKGKRGGARTIVALKKEDKAFFVYGFEKNKRSNISATDSVIYKKMAKLLFSYNNKKIAIAIKNKTIIEV